MAKGHQYKILYLKVPLAVARDRLRARNAESPPSAHFIPIEELERFSTIFEEPTDDEGLGVEVIEG